MKFRYDFHEDQFLIVAETEFEKQWCSNYNAEQGRYNDGTGFTNPQPFESETRYFSDGKESGILIRRTKKAGEVTAKEEDKG